MDSVDAGGDGDEGDAWRLTRRAIVQTGAALMAMPAAPEMVEAAAARPVANDLPTMTVRLEINGQTRQIDVDPRTTLLDALREHLQLTGTKKGCDHGQCGACTVLLDGRRINACLTLAVMHDGQSVTTIEGLGTPDKLHPMQAAFLAHDGFQCGYCTPGQICSAVGMLGEMRSGMPSHVTADLSAGSIPITPVELRERMSGNLCRCSAYPNVIASIEDVDPQGKTP